jgi:signal transduction histidine kinase
MESFGEMIYDDDGAPSRIVGVAIDVTEKKRAEEALRRSHLELENKVRERTQELAKSLSSLEMEVELRRQTENSLRDLSTRLLRLQDEERRRIARDLHDSTGQTLTALKLTLAALERLARSVPDAAALFEQLDGLAEEALRDIRTTSHLLHPPLLDEVGFRSAALWYVEGLAKRSGIEVKVDLDDAGARISKSAELAFFRVLQESLTNVLRHSGSKSVDITLEVESDMATLTIRDYGKGIPGHTLSSFRETGAGVGVGLGGMKQRIHEFGGRLQISSDGSGTSVSATLPLAATSQLNPENGKALDPQTDEIPGTDGQIAPQPE